MEIGIDLLKSLHPFDPLLELVELRHCIVPGDALDHPPGALVRLGTLVPLDEEPVSLSGIDELCLDRADVLLVAGDHLVAAGRFFGVGVAEVLEPTPFADRLPGEVFPPLLDRQSGPLLPGDNRCLGRGHGPLGPLPGGDRPGAVGLHLDEGVFHLLDHQPDQLVGVLGGIEHRVEVGIDDVLESREDTHGEAPEGRAGVIGSGCEEEERILCRRWGAWAWRGSGPPPAASPDVRFGLPGLRSLRAACAPPSMAPLAVKAARRQGAAPPERAGWGG